MFSKLYGGGGCQHRQVLGRREANVVLNCPHAHIRRREESAICVEEEGESPKCRRGSDYVFATGGSLEEEGVGGGAGLQGS